MLSAKVDIQNSSPSASPKYRALIILHKHGTSLPDWLLALEDEVVTVLSQDLDLTVIDQDFDYGEICDKNKPDFVIFTSPGCHRCVPLKITNGNAHPEIPRIGMVNYGTDPHDTARVVFLRMMDEYKIERFFSIQGAAAMRQSPELMGRVFIAPLFFDGDIFKDYGLEKDIPVSVFGWGVAPNFYNWRTVHVHEIFNHFPTLVYTHPGYGSAPERYRFPVEGVAYAKFLNRSYFSLADTTRVDYLVRKHLEIPASGSVLVSSPTSDVFYYGFRDMENCIMGSGMELYQKIALVANDPNLYGTMRKNGHDVVRRFTRDKWHCVRDWYVCQRSLRPGETVQQQGVFGPFIAVSGGAELPAVACDSLQDSEFSLGMKLAWQKILAGDGLDEAETALTQMLNWLGHLTEPWMLLGVIALLRGQAVKAKEFFMRPYQVRAARERGNTCLDPEEIAWLSLTGVLLADSALVQQMRAEASNVRYLGLRRVEWLFHRQGNLNTEPPSNVITRQLDDRLTTHWTGQLDINGWIVLMKRVMAVNR